MVQAVMHWTFIATLICSTNTMVNIEATCSNTSDYEFKHPKLHSFQKNLLSNQISIVAIRLFELKDNLKPSCEKTLIAVPESSASKFNDKQSCSENGNDFFGICPILKNSIQDNKKSLMEQILEAIEGKINEQQQQQQHDDDHDDRDIQIHFGMHLIIGILVLLILLQTAWILRKRILSNTDCPKLNLNRRLKCRKQFREKHPRSSKSLNLKFKPNSMHPSQELEKNYACEVVIESDYYQTNNPSIENIEKEPEDKLGEYENFKE